MDTNQLMLAFDSGDVIPILAVGGGLAFSLIWVITDYIYKLARTRAREQSRREIAAYVAEGTISPDDGVRLMEAGKSAEKKCG